MSNEQTTVLFVHRRDAKVVKTYLEGGVSLLDKQFRMAPVVDAAPAQDVESVAVGGHGSSSPTNVSNCIAVPVTADCIQWLRQKDSASDGDASSSGSSPMILDDTDNIISLIVGFGNHPCPYSSSMLGNNNKNRRRAATATKQKKSCQSTSDKQNARCDGSKNETLNDVQYALLETLNAWLESNATTTPTTTNEGVGNDQSIESLVRRLSNQTCPKKLEIMGDDRTLVVPSYSLFINNSQEGGIVCTSIRDGTTTIPKKGSGDFRELLNNTIQQKEQQQSVDQRECTKEEYIMDVYTAIQSQLWRTLATFYNSPRVVRRGDIDPESGVRESGHRILWPKPIIPYADSEPVKGDYNHGFQPTNTGPNSPGWITVTEHKIRQNFDLTRVMFSRGNVTEKKRFGRNLVQPGECVLDMYAGIGYYTLPALIHGQARHVVACEWNSHALYALRYNLKANGVDNRATVLEGDCRISLRGLIKRRRQGTNTDHERESTTTAEINQFDRISLGLLPSCEGGWPVAVSCLDRSTGGWLHVHANVPTIERTNWSHWLCRSLVNIASEQQKEDASMNSSEWIAVCSHVEKVKSYAPKVDHIVADVFLGPCDLSKVPGLLEGRKFCSTGVVESSSGRFTVTPCEVDPPSCALDEEGVLHQHWMMMMKEST